MIQELKKKINFKINSIQFVKRDGFLFLDIELPETDLESIEKKTKIISNILDEIDKSNESYYLNVFSSGTEKEIDIKNLQQYLEKNIYVKMKNPILNKFSLEGILVECENEFIIVKVNNKGRFQKVKIQKNDIKFIKLTAKYRKEK